MVYILYSKNLFLIFLGFVDAIENEKATNVYMSGDGE